MVKSLLAASLLIITSLDANSNLHAQWRQLGPYGGAITTVLMHGTEVFAGTNSGTVFRSTNSGASWISVSTGLPISYSVFALAAVGSDLFEGGYGGVFISSDNGADWSRSSTGLPNATYSTTNVTAFAALGQNVFAGTGDSGIYRSTNNGSTWMTSSNGFAGSNYVYTLVTLDSVLFAGTSGGIFRSSDSGKTWELASNGLTGSSLVVRGMSVKDSILYAATDSGVFHSSGRGTDWIPAHFTNDACTAITTDSSHIFAAFYPDSLYRSDDNGQTWVRIDSGFSASYVLSVQMRGSYFFAGTLEGFLRSIDSGSHWSQSDSGLIGGIFNSMYSDGTALLAGDAGGSGIWRSTDNGSEWNLALPGLFCYSITKSGQRIFATGNGRVYVSANEGLSWNSVGSGLPQNAYSPILAALGSILFVGSHAGVFRSMNNGLTWTPNSSGLNGTSLSVRALTTSGTNIFAGTYAGPYLSTDSGASWTPLDNGLPSNLSITALSTAGPNLYAGTGSDGVLLSTDTGQTWTSINNGLPQESLDVYALAASGSNLFISVSGAISGNGVYVSTNNGQAWQPATSKLTDLVHSFALSGSDLFAGTNASGIWRRPLSDFGISSVLPQPAASMEILTAYPNPATSSTTLRFTAPESGYATISIVNALGAEVARMYSGELSAGLQRITLNVPTFIPSGRYECVVRLESVREAIPVLIR